MSNILVSIVMITYGHEKYIEEAINGVFIQKTDFPVELIIANDNSLDNTDEIIKKVINKRPLNIEINYTKHKKNLGVIQNFIWSLDQSKGKYIALCEGDDYWTDEFKLQKQVDFLEKHNDFSMCFHNALKIFNINDKEEFCKFSSSKEIFLNDILSGWIIPTASIVFNKNILPLPKWADQIYSGDMTLALTAITKGKIMYINEIMSIYRIDTSGTSMSAVLADKFQFVLKEHIKLFECFLRDNKEHQFVISKKIRELKKELKFQRLKNKNLLYAFLNMPFYFFTKTISSIQRMIKNG